MYTVQVTEQDNRDDFESDKPQAESVTKEREEGVRVRPLETSSEATSSTARVTVEKEGTEEEIPKLQLSVST